MPIGELTLLQIEQYKLERAKRESNPTAVRCAVECMRALNGRPSVFDNRPPNFNRHGPRPRQFNNGHNGPPNRGPRQHQQTEQPQKLY